MNEDSKKLTLSQLFALQHTLPEVLSKLTRAKLEELCLEQYKYLCINENQRKLLMAKQLGFEEDMKKRLGLSDERS